MWQQKLNCRVINFEFFGFGIQRPDASVALCFHANARQCNIVENRVQLGAVKAEAV
jgi:hypothetical protein